MPIRVHVASDDEELKDALVPLLAEDENISVVFRSKQAEAGAIALDNTRPDVAILAVPPTEDTYRHAMLYRQAADEETALIGLCTSETQAEEYQLAGIETVVRLTTETSTSLREKVISAHEALCVKQGR